MDGHSSGGIGLVRLCLKWQEYKKESCFDVLRSGRVGPAVQCVTGPSSALQRLKRAVKYSTNQTAAV